MKKMIVITAIGLLLGMGGAVGIVVVREKQARAVAPRPVAADTTAHSDSIAHADSARLAVLPDSAQPDSSMADSVFSDSAYAAAHVPADSTAATGTGSSAAQRRPGSMVAEVAAANQEAGPDEQRLARIFAAMRPEEAARVLEQMTDPEIRRLLSHLRERQAAAIMSNISPERAAVISSAVIRGERSSP
jgi:hypothetical protein